MCIKCTNTAGLYRSAALTEVLRCCQVLFKLDDMELFDFGIKESVTVYTF